MTYRAFLILLFDLSDNGKNGRVRNDVMFLLSILLVMSNAVVLEGHIEKTESKDQAAEGCIDDAGLRILQGLGYSPGWNSLFL